MKMEDNIHISVGGNGTILHTGTTVYTNLSFRVLQVNSDCTFTTLTDETGLNLLVELGITSSTCTAGSIIKSRNNKRIGSITLATGSVWGIL